MRVLGFMTGTSLDAVDIAVVETDGEAIHALGAAGERKLDPAARALIETATRDALAWRWDEPRPASFAHAEAAIAEQHLIAARAFLAAAGLTRADLDLVGLHGQTVLHEPPIPGRERGRTIQLIDAQRVADGLGLPVAYDFRTADVAAGGQGAPLAPIYHAALARWSRLEAPVAALNLGGVANVTLVAEDGALQACDTGPANGMIDLFVQARTGARCDVDGALARAGRIHEDILAGYLAHPYFAALGPKSLDRYDFSLDPVAGLGVEDGAATLTAFAAEAVALGLRALAPAPREVVACGGGRLNPALMAAIAERAPMRVRTAEEVGWRGDSIEAEAFAYLAARTARGLPISFPGTTGVPRPMTGGRIRRPEA
ncbi:MAG TPA: anhydro-N-acetylmuramic acid kinase [Caulobacteraceae bacterium]|nr:anhydro-N-acetylmuramic acid kinase [Caulobacteraceae bacterium]